MNLEFGPEFVHVAFSSPIARRKMGAAFNRNIRQGDLNGMRGGSTDESVEQMSQEEMPVN